ncbi:response regulator [Methanoregula sp.]|uniref:response regulator n=1 Tax=Methanoregula sp. TaxID=2052170 RepID=UPI00263082DD|nr:response regulator [Methanoregula sp.]MDD5141926.1 response regulator [Methanoregula sp.]
MSLRILSSLLIIVLVCCSFCPYGAAADPVVPDFDKIVRIQLKYLDGAYSLESAEIQYGRAPNLALQSGELKGSILDTTGKERLSFSSREPWRAQGDILGDPEGRTLIGYTEGGDASDMSITVPWVQDMAAFTLTDSRDGALLVTADLTPAASLFCADYPGDPDCQARGASSQLAAMEPAPQATSLPIVFMVLFSLSVFLAAGLAIMTVRRRVAATGIPEGATAAIKAVKQTVLIVDDDPEMVEIIHQFLTDEGYATIHALSGKECLNILKKQLPDLILLDVLMQPMNGWETLEQIKKDPITKPIPVLMLTGKRLTSAEAKQYNICIDDYITKPFRHEEIFTAIDNILQRKQRFKDGLELAKKVGVDREKFCELAKLSRRITVNKKIIDILQAPAGTPAWGPDELTPENKEVIEQITITTRANEQRAEQLKTEINKVFRSKGVPEINW